MATRETAKHSEGEQRLSAPSISFMSLRVQEIDFSLNEILVRDGNGAKDRITMLPESPKVPLQDHLKQVKAVHEQDVADGWGRVQLPHTLDRKYPNTPQDWRWQWVFPQEHRWVNGQTKEQGRHHLDESLVQKAVREERPWRRPGSRSGLPATHFDILLPRTYSKAVLTFEPSRSCWDIRMSKRQ